MSINGESDDQLAGGQAPGNDHWEDSQQEEDRERLHALRESHLEQLERFFKELFSKVIFNKFTEQELQTRLDRMHKHFDNMEKAHTLYRQVCMLASNRIYATTETRYMRAVSKIKRRLKELSSVEQSSFQAGIAANSTINPTVIRVETARVPQLGKFNGTPCDWPAFRDLFIAEVHSKDFDNVTKLLYLQEACIERAAATLGPWQPTADNYKAAWDMMMSAYDDDYHVIQGILGKMGAVGRQEKESHTSLRAVLDSLNSCTRQLDAIVGRDVQYDQCWIHNAKQKLPQHTRDAWEQRRSQRTDGALPTLDEFKKFLDTKAKGRREYEQETNWSNQGEGSSKSKQDSGQSRYKPYDKNASHRNNSERPWTKRPSGPPKCVMSGCGQTHYLDQCEAFNKLTHYERVNITREHRLCRVCLLPGHMALECKRSQCKRCPESKIKHHHKICGKQHEANKQGAKVEKKEPTP